MKPEWLNPENPRLLKHEIADKNDNDNQLRYKLYRNKLLYLICKITAYEKLRFKFNIDVKSKVRLGTGCSHFRPTFE